MRAPWGLAATSIEPAIDRLSRTRGEEAVGSYAKGSSERKHLADSQVALAALDRAQRGAIDSARLRQLDLSQAGLVPQLSHSLPECDQSGSMVGLGWVLRRHMDQAIRGVSTMRG